MNCKSCGQTITAKLIAAKKKRRGENIRKGLLRAQSNGHAIGRPKILDDKEIKALSKTGWSLQALATTYNVSRSAIQHALRRTRNKTVKE